MTPRILDSTAPLSFFAKNGYYSIGDAVAVHAVPAYQEATRTKLPIKWNFNDEVYNNFDWRSRLNLPITELYRRRAQQLRDKYDYLILWFSGGADSTTVLESFVNNGIHLDEVVVTWARTQTAGKYTPNFNTDPSNFKSEWDFSIEPKLQWLAKNHPNVRITVLDHMGELDPFEDYADTWTVVEKHNYASIQRQRISDQSLRERSSRYKNVASIAGCNPPEVAICDGKWLAVYFNNVLASGGNGKSDYLLDGTPRNVEYFYWSPDCPEMLREQGHIILDRLNSDRAARELFTTYGMRSKGYDYGLGPDVHEARRTLIKSLVYPNWDLSTFQVKKPTDFYIECENYEWFFSNPESNAYLQAWKSAINSQYALIDKSWFGEKNRTLNYLRPFYSKFHIIGQLT